LFFCGKFDFSITKRPVFMLDDLLYALFVDIPEGVFGAFFDGSLTDGE